MLKYNRGCVVQSRVCSTIEAHNQYNRGCAVKSRHIVSIIEGVQYKRVDYHVLVQGALLKILSDE